MSLPIKLICRKSKALTDDNCPVYIQHCCDEKHKPLFGTEVRIPLNYWNKKKRCLSSQLPKEYGDYKAINDELIRRKKIVEDLVSYALLKKVQNRVEFVKRYYSPAFDISEIETKEKEIAAQQETEKKNKLSVYYQFDEFIKSKERKVSKATLTVYGNVKSHLLAFEEFQNQEITFDSFDFNFYEDFVDYLSFEHVHMRRKTLLAGLKLNTIGKTIKHLRG
ncbi:phage integrase SAM-like domain-containing protein [Niabella hibiscisoli]|uniref:phage integrase SAM-like domain-containing protein n=1 Tax=Niabella hibiscisoli TaxID=1825928 RepID=UPI001F0EF69A|nr:phage integrase SAM-like domain-containing protein [Niabella hibiscisoli]MCH5721255.1 phage integrase SAM-like domain and Arm DNA-binding domain-containing protein [Niabella hibiscisoli]